MRKGAEPNGYMTLKVELMNTKISRTIVVPEHMTLEDLNDAIQSVMGWQDEHLWSFTDNRRDGALYELPHEDDGFPPFSKRLTLDASKVILRKVFPKRGAKMYYEYDFGDSWEHVVTRQADPKMPEIACLKMQGPDGIEDFGGAWRLHAFIETMKANPASDEYSEVREWAGLETSEKLMTYLNGRSTSTMTEELRDVLSHVKPAEKKPDVKPMAEEEKANTLGMIFATLVNARLWKILEKALAGDGTCEFEDYDKTIGEFFLTVFDGLKVKDGRGSSFFVEPSKLTVHREWVEMYRTHGEEWHRLHEQFDILEQYASSSVRLYGVVSIGELYDIVLRYDSGCTVSSDEMLRLLESRAVHDSKMLYRVEGGLVISADSFPVTEENVGEAIDQFRREQSEYPRWHPSSREELFDFENVGSFERTPESGKVEGLLKKICRANPQYNDCDSLFAIYNLLTQGLRPETVYDFLRERDVLPKLGDHGKRELLEAVDHWGDVVHMPILNGNTVKDLRAIVASQPKATEEGRNEPCPCGSGKKFKHCGGMNQTSNNNVK